MIPLLIASGHSDASIMLRSRHADITSLQSYHNLRKHHGAVHLMGLFGGNNTSFKHSAEGGQSWWIRTAEFNRQRFELGGSKEGAGLSCVELGSFCDSVVGKFPVVHSSTWPLCVNSVASIFVLVFSAMSCALFCLQRLSATCAM